MHGNEIVKRFECDQLMGDLYLLISDEDFLQTSNYQDYAQYLDYMRKKFTPPEEPPNDGNNMYS